MATERFLIRIEERGTKTVRRNLDRVGRSARSTARTLAFLRSALVVVASARVLANFSNLLDTFTNTSNLLRQITRDTQELNVVQTRLFQIAQETRASFESTVTFFQRLARSTVDLSQSFGDLFDITETVGELLALSGATAQEASNALIQFSQGLAAGALQGEELLSVTEQLPALAEVIAREFGVSAGQLRALNEQTPGILETERVINALADAAPEISERFENAVITIDQGFTRVRNALIFFTGQFNAATGASQALASALTVVAENIGLIVTALAGLAGVVAFNLIVNQVVLLSSRIISLTVLFSRGIGIAAVAAVSALRAAFVGLLNVVALVRNAMLALTGLTIPLSVLGALVAGTLVGAFFLFKETIDDALESLGGFAGIFDTILANALATVDTIVENWRDIPAVFQDLGIQAANAFLRGLDLLLQGAEDVFNFISEGVGLDRVEFGSVGQIANDAAGAVDNFTAAFDRNLAAIEEQGGGVASLQARTEALIDTIQSFTGGQIPEELLDEINQRLPQVTGGEGGLEDQDVIDLKDDLANLLAEVSPLADATQQLAEAQEILNDAMDEGLITEGESEEVTRRLRREIVGVGNDVVEYEESLQLLNEALADGVINQEEFKQAARDLRIELLDEQTSIAAGFERTFLKMQESAQDGAQFIEDSITAAFRGVEDAIVEFANTGKLSIRDFVNSVQADLLRLATRGVLQTVVGGLGQQLQNSGGGGLLGGLTNLLGLGGGGGALGSVLDFQSGLPGFADGGTFPVNRQNSIGNVPGVDNRVVAFRANDSEEVEVRKKNRRDEGGGGTTINQTFNIQTPDAESFKRSQGQILTRAAAAVNRAGRRNG